VGGQAANSQAARSKASMEELNAQAREVLKNLGSASANELGEALAKRLKLASHGIITS